MFFGQQLEHDPSLKKPQRLFFILIGALFLIAPFYYQPNLGGEGLFIPHNSALWIVACWVIASASYIVYKSKQIILPRYWFGLALLPIGAILTGFIAENNNLTEWIVRISVIIGGYLFLISLFQFQLSSRHIERSLYIILAMGLIVSTYGLIQTQTGAKGLSFIPLSANFAPVGIFQHINLQVSFMATLLTLCFYISSRPSLDTFSILIKITLVLTVAIATYTIVISGSRTGLLACIVSLVLFFIGRLSCYKNRKTILVSLFIAMAIGGYLGKDGIRETTYKINETVDGMETDMRWNIYSISWDLYQQAPLFGHGIGSFQKVFQEKRQEYQQNEGWSLGRAARFSHPHNEMIFWLVEGGLVAIIGIICAAVFTFLQLMKAGWQRGWGYAALLVPITLHTQVELPFYISNTHWFLILFLLFVVHQHKKTKASIKALSLSAQKLIPLSFTLLAFLSTNFLIHSQAANAGIINYLKHRQNNPLFLKTAVNNAYFREYSTYLLLRHNMYIGISENNLDPANDYIHWASKSIEVIPAVTTYRDLVIAYNFKGDTFNRDKALDKALNIYPQDSSLLNLKQKIHLNDQSKLRNEQGASQAQSQANPPQ